MKKENKDRKKQQIKINGRMKIRWNEGRKEGWLSVRKIRSKEVVTKN